MKHTALIFATLVLTNAGPAHAQVVPVGEAAGYQIASVPSQGVCFAALQTVSEAGKPMVYSYYQTGVGQRWHVAGYIFASELPDGDVTVTVQIDETTTLSRATETRDGDFMLPFAALDEIEAHENLVPEGEAMTLTVNDDDRLVIPLDDYRAAYVAIQSCLTSL